MDTLGFDNKLYADMQRKAILARIGKSGERLYLEFGGKLFDDMHAARVLPGFDSAAKIKLLQALKNKLEIIITVSAKDLDRGKVRADSGINYGLDVLRLIDAFRSRGLLVRSVVVTQFKDQPAADAFKNKLQRRGEQVHIHYKTKGYPTDIDTIISDEGYGKNPYIECSRPLVVVTAPGPGSGKLATCLCQMYHEQKRGINAGYAKFETFPVWNLPLKHPVNLAYEAATADIKDVNQIDIYHLEAYGKASVNYNRDIEVFPLVRSILHKITGGIPYKSPTDMGVNKVGFAIKDDGVVSRAAKQEIIRRYFKARCEYLSGGSEYGAVEKIELLMSEAGISVSDRKCVAAALERAQAVNVPVVAVEINLGNIITGRQNKLLSAAASAILNAVKRLANIPDEINLISPVVIEPITKMKHVVLDMADEALSLDEVLIALSISAATNPTAELALKQLPLLAGLEAHSSCIMKPRDESAMKKLKINVTMQPEFEGTNLFNE